MEARDRAVIRVVLTMLSIFRIIKYKGTLKLSTITSPFKGLSQTLHPVEVAIVWKLFTPYLPNFSIDKLGINSPLILKTAGPNFKTSILGAPKDALA
jgi:hypothetical protein